MKDELTELVFVYGSLRNGASNEERMYGSECQGAATIRGYLYQIDWYPGLKIDVDAGPVVGEIWKITSQHLQTLDAYEGLNEGELEGEEYRRVRADVAFVEDMIGYDSDFADSVNVWVWEWKGQPKEEQLIPSGDWMDVERPKQAPLFTSIGCLGIIAIPVGGQVIANYAFRYFPLLVIEEKWRLLAFAMLGLIAAGLGVWTLVMANRRREPGRGCFLGFLALMIGLIGLSAVISLVRSLVLFFDV